MVTAGGLIFIAHFGDRTVRAYDKDNGKILWEKKMPPNFAGIPSVYDVNGRQFIAFYGSSFEKPAEGNVAWEAGEEVRRVLRVCAAAGTVERVRKKGKRIVSPQQ